MPWRANLLQSFSSLVGASSVLSFLIMWRGRCLIASCCFLWMKVPPGRISQEDFEASDVFSRAFNLRKKWGSDAEDGDESESFKDGQVGC